MNYFHDNPIKYMKNQSKNKFQSNFKNIDTHYISSVTMTGITELKDMIWKKLN